MRKKHGLKGMATPINKVVFKYNIGSASRDHAVQLELIQFPLKLAWGATGHKFQGATVPKPDCMVAHLDTIFGKGNFRLQTRNFFII